MVSVAEGREKIAREGGERSLTGVLAKGLDLAKLVFSSGGPGTAQLVLNNACNANCDFCGFARERLSRDRWRYVERQGALDALSILYRQGIRYVVLTGGEPTLHPNHVEFVRRGADLGLSMIMVTNGALLKPPKVNELIDAGLAHLSISIDAADQETHERNRGLPGVCDRIVDANRILGRAGIPTTAIVTVSKLVDFDALPDFLRQLGFAAASFSYPMTTLPSFYLSYSDSELVDYSNDELLDVFARIKRLKKLFPILNPARSLDEMQRFLRKEPQRHECLAGWRLFFVDWDLMVWRCQAWDEPICSIYDFDSSKYVRDGCTKCMINCNRDVSLMQGAAVSLHDSWQAVKRGRFVAAGKAIGWRATLDSLSALTEQQAHLRRLSAKR